MNEPDAVLVILLVVPPSRNAQREAERLEAKLRAEVAEGRYRGSAARTVAELLDAWPSWCQASGEPISPHTLNDYRSRVRGRAAVP